MLDKLFRVKKRYLGTILTEKLHELYGGHETFIYKKKLQKRNSKKKLKDILMGIKGEE